MAAQSVSRAAFFEKLLAPLVESGFVTRFRVRSASAEPPIQRLEVEIGHLAFGMDWSPLAENPASNLRATRELLANLVEICK